MKRFLIIIILLFPVLTLAFWVYRGVTTPSRTAPNLFQTNAVTPDDSRAVGTEAQANKPNPETPSSAK
jgi:hypothetical protein